MKRKLRISSQGGTGVFIVSDLTAGHIGHAPSPA